MASTIKGTDSNDLIIQSGIGKTVILKNDTLDIDINKIPVNTIGTSTDNAIVRFDGLTGKVQNSGVVIDDSNNIGVGAGSFGLSTGGVNKLVVKTTGVELDATPTIGDNSLKIATTAYVDTQMGTRGRLVQMTAQNSTSGTSIDFTGIPSWVKRITVMLNGVSTSGTSNYIIQLGISTGVETTGYAVYASTFGSTSVASSIFNNGFGIRISRTTEVASGRLLLHNITGNIWSGDYAIADSSNGESFFGAGSKTLSGVLDRVRITTVNGTDTFDAGSINIMYEG